MSKKPKKMLNVAINTDALTLNADPKDVAVPRLKERYVKHIRIAHVADIQETYNFGEQIGQGGFGKVLSVVERQTNKDWAMKIVSKSAVGNKIETVYREIKILKMVNHPHIIYLDKVYESAKNIYLVLELCYTALSTVYKERKLFSEKDTRKIIRDLAGAISYLHKNDIVHRDLKLDNILIAKNPTDREDKLFIKVSDFGLSIVKQGNGHENMLHDWCGTPTYMAPEIITTQSYSQQCDIWAIGVIMYVLLSGKYPFSSANEQELSTLICKAEPSYSALKSSPEAIHLITKLLAKNPALRITAGELIDHPWIAGKPMLQDSDSPENVLDMMRLWRSEMMLPMGADCDWVKSAKAIGNSTAFRCDKATAGARSPQAAKEQSEDSDIGGLGARARKQSMHLPVKNIRFERPTNQIRGPGRSSATAAGVEELRTNRRGPPAPSTPTPTSSRRSCNASKLVTTHTRECIKSPNTKAPDNDKGRQNSKQHG